MKIEVLKAFLTVAQTNSVSDAAELLYVSQSTVSRYIQELEKELNCALFIRSTHGIRLTRAGLMVFGQIQRLVDDWEQIRFVASRYSSQAGVLRIGYLFQSALAYVSRALDDSAKTSGYDFNVTLTYGQAKELCMMVLHETLDCVIMHRPCVMQSNELRAMRIVPSSMSVMVHNSHPLAHEKSITMAQLCGEIESRTSRDPEFFEAAENAFYQMGLKPPVHVAASEPADCYFAMQHKGYFCFRCSIYPPEEGFSVIPVSDWPVDYDLMLVCSERSHNLAVDSFFQAVRKQFESDANEPPG